jgi:hypothetical protein
MLQIEYFIQIPMEMVGNVGYLLIDLFERVAYDSPPKFARSISTGFPQ